MLRRIKIKLLKVITGIPNLIDYNDIINHSWNDRYEGQEDVLPTLIPNWDHSPRSGKNASIIRNSTPTLWKKYVKKILSYTKTKKHIIIMLKSWNEWGEGNYIEPDFNYGTEYLNVLKETINEVYNQ